VRKEVLNSFQDNMTVADKSSVNGLHKAWMYQHFISRKLVWPFLVYDFPPALGSEPRTLCNRLLKKWIGVYKSADISILYHVRERFGLQLTDPASLLKKMQITKCLIIKHSFDQDLARTYKLREAREAEESGKVRPTVAVSEYERQASFEQKFKTGPLYSWA
jgi:hypothetical protein